MAEVDIPVSAPLERRFGAALGSLVAGNFANRLLGMVLSIWLARYLGQRDFGKLSYVQAYLGLFAVLPGFGLDRVLPCEIARDVRASETTLANAFLIKVLIALPCAAAAAAIAQLVPVDHDVRMLLVFGSLCMLGAVAQPIWAFFDAQLNCAVPKLIDVASGVFGMVVAIIAMAHGASLMVVAGLLLFLGRPGDTGLPTLLPGWLIIRRLVTLRLGYNGDVCRRLVSLAAPAALSSILVMAAARLDQMLIAPMLGPGALGQYSAAVRVTEACGIFSSSLVVALGPLMTVYSTTASDRLERSYSLCFRYLSALAFALITVVLLVGAPLLVLVFGPAYAGATKALQILMGAQLFVFWLSVASPFLYANRRIGHVLCINAVNAVSNLLLNVYWIPRFGIAGAATATLGSFAIACASMLLFAETARLSRTMWGSSARPLAACCASWCVCRLLWHHLNHPVAAAVLGLLFYGVLLLMIGGLSFQDIRAIMRTGLFGRTAAKAGSG